MEPEKPRGKREYRTIRFETKGKICHIVLNRPEVLNAINDELQSELADALFELDSDPDLWVGIISGEGRAFCSGADVKQRHLATQEERRSRRRPPAVRMADSVNWKPMIAAVHGYAFGGGYGISQSCDLVIAADETLFEITEVSRGTGGSTLWAQTWFAGGGRFANELALTGRRFTAEEAFEQGIINRVVSRDQLIATAEELADQINENPPLSVRCNVRVMRHFAHEMRNEASYYQEGLQLHSTEDFKESARAFVEKREPEFHGR